MKYVRFLLPLILCIALCGSVQVEAAVLAEKPTSTSMPAGKQMNTQNTTSTHSNKSTVVDRITATCAALKKKIIQHPLITGVAAGATIYVAYLIKKMGNAKSISELEGQKLDGSISRAQKNISSPLGNRKTQKLGTSTQKVTPNGTAISTASTSVADNAQPSKDKALRVQDRSGSQSILDSNGNRDRQMHDTRVAGDLVLDTHVLPSDSQSDTAHNALLGDGSTLNTGKPAPQKATSSPAKGKLKSQNKKEASSKLLHMLAHINEQTEFEQIKALLASRDSKGAHTVDINAKDTAGNSALHYACHALLRAYDLNNDTDITKALLEKQELMAIVDIILSIDEIDVNAQDAHGKTSLMQVIACDWRAILKDNKGARMQEIVTDTRTSLLKKLYDTKKIQVDVADKQGQTALMYVVKEIFRGNCFHNVELDRLITYAQTDCYDMNSDQGKKEFCAWVNHEDVQNATALTYAVTFNSGEEGSWGDKVATVQCLIGASADPNKVVNDQGHTLLMWTALDEDGISLFKKLLSAQNIQVNTQDKEGLTVLHHIVSQDDVGLLTLLLQTPHVQVDTAIENHAGDTALHALLKNLPRKNFQFSNRHEFEAPICMISSLLNYGADVNSADSNGDTPLMLACKEKNLELVQAIIDRPMLKTRVDFNATNAQGNTALSLAACCHHKPEITKPMVDALLSAGADINKRYAANNVFSYDWTLLDYAVKINNFEMVQDLFGRNIAVDVPQLKEMKKAMSSCSYSQKDIGELLDTIIAQKEKSLEQQALQEQNNHNQEFFRVMEDPHSTAQQKRDAQQKIQVNFSDLETGCTLLHDAARLGHVNSVTYLLRNKAQVDVRTKYGNRKGNMTPLHYAAREGHVEVVRLLIEHVEKDAQAHSYNIFMINKQGGRYFNEADEDGRTPLILAAGNGHLEVVRFLLSQYSRFGKESCGREEISGKSCFVRDSDHSRCNAAMHAIKSQSPQALAIVQLLLDNEFESNQDTFSCAVKTGNMDIIEVLLKRGRQSYHCYKQEDFVHIVKHQSLSEEARKKLMLIAIQQDVVSVDTLKRAKEQVVSSNAMVLPDVHSVRAVSSDEDSLLSMLTRELSAAEQKLQADCDAQWDE